MFGLLLAEPVPLHLDGVSLEPRAMTEPECDHGVCVTNAGCAIETLTCLGCERVVDMARVDPARGTWVREHVLHEKIASTGV